MNDKLKAIDSEIKRLEGFEKSLAAGLVGFGQGVTYGGSDEAAAVLGSLGRGSIEEEQAMQERIRKGAAEQNPAAYTTGQIAGAVFSPVNKVLGAGANLIKGANQVGKGVAAAVTGGALGGFLSGEGGADERLDDAASGAGMAGAADLALRGAGKVVRGIGNQVGTSLGLRGVEKVANEKLLKSVERGGSQVEDVAQALQDPRNLPLNANRDLAGLADDVINRPSSAQTGAQEALEAQRLGAKGVATQALTENLDDAARYGDEVTGVKQRLKDIGEQQYNKIVRPDVRVRKEVGPSAIGGYQRVDQTGNPLTKRLPNKIFQDETIRQAIKRVEADPALGFNPAERDTLPYLHKLQSIMGQEAQGLRSALDPALRDKARASGLETARRKIISAIEDIEPKYAKARKDFADESELESAMQAGRDFMRGDADEVLADFKNMPKQAQDLFRLSAAKELGLEIEKKGFAAQANKIIAGGDEDLRRRLKTIFPDAKSFNSFVDRVKAEKGRFETAGKILGGSQTYARQQRGQDTDMLDAALTAYNGGISGTIRNVVGAARLPEKYTAQLAKDLTEQTPAGRQALIDRLLKERAARSAAQQSSLRRSASIGGLIGQEPNRRN